MSLMEKPEIGRAWFDNLYDSSDGGRLAICLVIDIHHRAVNPRLVADILDTLGTRVQEGRWAFAEAVERHPIGKRFDCVDCVPREADPKRTYLRIVDLWEFIEYYAGPTYYHTFSVEEVDTVYEIFLEDLKHTNLGDIKLEWTGGRGRAWVAPLEEHAHRTKGLTEDEAATSVNDFLGLAKKPSPAGKRKTELLAVTYPAGFDPGCRLPTALDPSWRNPGGYYLSYGDVDGWGRTQSCSGQPKPCPERVHSGFVGLSDAFSVSRVGEVRELVEDRRALLLEAYQRCPLK